MTEKHFKAFANYIVGLRQMAKEHSNMEGESELIWEQAQECENMVVVVAFRINDQFNEARFRQACASQ
ncbi:MAG: hypothetical protein AABY22_24280 [Nanoarchaeota archaeon]